MSLFQTKKTPKEHVTEWTSKLRKEGYKLDRQIQSVQREQHKLEASLKAAAKKGDRDVCRVYAKEIVAARKAVSRIYVAKANINSVELEMKSQLSMLRVSGAIQKSTDVMKNMQQLIRVQEIQATMQEMAKEMMKAGIMDEMMDDAMESALGDSEDIEDAAQEEVDKVLFELTAGALGAAPAAPSESLPSVAHDAKASVSNKRVPAGKVAATPVAIGADSDDEEQMRERLEALRS